MFDRKLGDGPAPTGPPDRAPFPVAGQASQTASATRSQFGSALETGSSVIGTDLTIHGEKIVIISQNRLQINGNITGDVSGKQVTISTEGSVTGTVSAEEIEVLGSVHGAIRAVSVVLHPSSKVDAEIFNQTLVISKGAQFEGGVRRSDVASELMPNLDTNSYSTSSSASR